MSYMHCIRPERPPTFDTHQCSNPTRRASPGVVVLACQERRQNDISRLTPLPMYHNYDYRAPDQLKQGDIPRVTLSALASTVNYSSKVVLPGIQQCGSVERKKNPKNYLGPTAHGSLYHRPKTIQEQPVIVPILADNTNNCKAAQLRDKVEISKKHTGAWIKDASGIECWSCCCSEDKNAEGCVEVIRKPGKTMYEWTQNVIVR